MSLPKIGAVSYLNTKPLVAGLDSESNEFEVVFDLPSRLADRLADAELDVALIPVIEAITNPDYTIVSDACIACHGPVWSVKLMSRCPMNEVKTLALDEGSRTSCSLTKVMLAKQFNETPRCQPLSIASDWTTTECDAALIIGDRAMKADNADFPFVWDLGQAWNSWTKLPFVFAVWAARKGADLDRLDSVLSQSRDLGMRQLEAIANEQAPLYRLTTDECLSYLREYLHFTLGPDEKNGMNLFFQHAADLSLIPQSLRLQFHDCQTTG